MENKEENHSIYLLKTALMTLEKHQKSELIHYKSLGNSIFFRQNRIDDLKKAIKMLREEELTINDVYEGKTNG
ncbi:hypothetical protein LCGC14_1588530 [marine sediment metagenome]|uniref:Uncharacterized protein n=1 Tax=marine sediment metagenome TaxID=412755 RepID=A0A0F9KVH0_9ZZZZ